MSGNQEFVVVWHSPKPKLVDICTSLEDAIESRREYRKTHPIYTITIYKEIMEGLG